MWPEARKIKFSFLTLLNGEQKGSIDCAFKDAVADYTDGYIGDLVLSADGKKLYAVDQIGFRMIIADTETGKTLHHIPVGRYPFGICLSPDGRKAYVANVGMFQYNLLPGITEENAAEKAAKYPAFAYGSREMIEGIENDSVSVPGLGRNE